MIRRLRFISCVQNLPVVREGLLSKVPSHYYSQPVTSQTLSRLVLPSMVLHQLSCTTEVAHFRKFSSLCQCVSHDANPANYECTYHSASSRNFYPLSKYSTMHQYLAEHRDSILNYGQLRSNSTNCRHRRTVVPMFHEHHLTLSAKAIVDASPLSMQPYLRLIRFDRPIGTWLTFLPSVWSLSLAAPVGQLPDMKLVCLFGLGAFFMRSAGCTINDMLDRDFDSQVARTKNRPIASGEISRMKAFVFLALPLSASLGILLTLNFYTIVLGTFALLPVAIYPLMKRLTYWPQCFLGLTFNYGVLLGWSAVRGVLEWPVLPLYASCIAWTLIYDTIYAFQDREDDLIAGVKSTAVRFGDMTKLWLSGFTTLMTAGLTTTGLLCNQTWPYYLGVSVFTAHVAHQIYTVNLSDANDCGAKFRSNRNIGLIFWFFIIAASIGSMSGETVPVASTDNTRDDKNN